MSRVTVAIVPKPASSSLRSIGDSYVRTGAITPCSRLEPPFFSVRARTEKDAASRREHGVIAPVRTYESPIDRRLEDAGFGTIATVTLLMKDTLVRVAEPALVPAGVR